MKLKTLILILFLVSIIACNQLDLIPAYDTVKLELEEQWNDFIEGWHAEDAKKCAAMYSEDGVNIPPDNSAKTGHAEIEAFYDFLFDNNLSSKYTHTIDTLYLATNSMVTELGHFEVNWTRNDSSTWTYQARTCTIWEKEGNEWKIQSFLFNNPPNND